MIQILSYGSENLTPLQESKNSPSHWISDMDRKITVPQFSPIKEEITTIIPTSKNSTPGTPKRKGFLDLGVISESPRGSPRYNLRPTRFAPFSTPKTPKASRYSSCSNLQNCSEWVTLGMYHYVSKNSFQKRPKINLFKISKISIIPFMWPNWPF